MSLLLSLRRPLIGNVTHVSIQDLCTGGELRGKPTIITGIKRNTGGESCVDAATSSTTKRIRDVVQDTALIAANRLTSEP
ncbi:transferase family protein [Corchorus olitorius]|uniref:Transferase family protein n=1 Tax=Corchorus olitorius TaxID=93759 RepID=A0A1R3I8Z8_9ROSI|nr:transferase family protein [Corchorus olitorius]